ncbi:hypothetical protein [Ekhidna sp.]
MTDDYRTTEGEVAKVIYDTDVYQEIRKLSLDGAFEASELIGIVTVNINSHNELLLRPYPKGHSDRLLILEELVHDELEYYLLELKNRQAKN